MANIGKSERVAIYIDGGNFYGRLRDEEISFPKGCKFNYSALADFLASGRALVSKRYYVGIVRNLDGSLKSTDMVRAQQKFLAGLENEGFAVKKGRIVYDHAIREKGVDVKLALDIVLGAVEDKYDTAIVVSSDTDLVPAIEYLKYKQKKVEYVGFSHRPSLGMQKYADTVFYCRKKISRVLQFSVKRKYSVSKNFFKNNERQKRTL